ncbi:DUF3575 domain-containing protein [Petrimonas sp.]|uniref:DUF3575 domain-containing protein n=1 Tax=Petrimonas sp. TaxID=2023866 RepID=UPI003F51A097
MYKIHRFFIIYLLLSTCILSSVYAQKVAVKTNLGYWGAAASPNAALEFALGKKFTLEAGGGFNLWEFSDNKKAKHWLAQPELRYWFCDVFNGHFIGLHGHGAQFNIGNWDIPVGRLEKFKDHRYEGYLYGAGLSYGYQWVLSPRWNFEASLGGGFARIHYDKFPCTTCGTKLDEGDYNYWGVTKAAVSLIYFFK